MTEIVDHGVTGEIIKEISEPVGLVMINCTFIEQSLSALFEITADEVYAAGRKVKRPFGLDDKIKVCGKIFRNVEHADPLQGRGSIEPTAVEENKSCPGHLCPRNGQQI